MSDLGSYVFDPETDPDDEGVLYEGLLCAGDILLWIGREKSRKSNLVLQFFICAALGHPRPLKVVVVDFETKGKSLHQRYKAVSDALGLTDDQRKLLRGNLKIVMVREYIRAGQALPKFPMYGKKTSTRHEVNFDGQPFWGEFAARFPADLYVFDPMRSLHAGDENDSAIEGLLSTMRGVFRDSAVVIVHHTRKRNMGANTVSLQDDMRAWSDEARGSSALKAHADVVVCQERKIDRQGNEIVDFGAFSKDAADVDPIALEETDVQSFLWSVRADVPSHLRSSLDRLRQRGSSFADVNAAVKTLQVGGVTRPTAYRHVNGLIQAGILIQSESGLIIRKAGNGKW